MEPAVVPHAPPTEGSPGQPSGRRGGRAGALSALRPIHVLLTVYILVGIGRIHEHFSVLLKFRPSMTIFFLLLAYAIVVPGAVSFANLGRTWQPKVLLGLGLWACLSVAFGISLGASAIFFLEEYSRVLIFTLIMIAALRTVLDVRVLVWAFVLSTLFWVYLSFFVLDRGLHAAGGIDRIFGAYTFDPNDMCVIFAVGIPLGLLAFQTSGRIGKVISAITVLGSAGAATLTGSRGGFIGLLAVGVALLLLIRSISLIKRVTILVVMAAVMVWAAPPGYWGQMNTILDEDDYNWTDEYGRKQIMQRGIGYMMSYPVFGVGINNFARAERELSERGRSYLVGLGVRAIAPHNTLVQVGAEMGIPAVVLWLTLTFSGIVGLLRIRRRLPREWEHSGDPEQRFLYSASTMLPVAFIGFTATSLFVSFAYLAPFYVLVALLSGHVILLRAAVPELVPRTRWPVSDGVVGWRSARTGGWAGESAF
jgi:O-antigen ligase